MHHKYRMYVETDWDFSVEFQGVVHSDDEFTLEFDSVEQLDELKLHGAFGALDCEGKTWEFLAAIEKIKANPDDSFSNLGGNRGVYWSVCSCRTCWGLEYPS